MGVCQQDIGLDRAFISPENIDGHNSMGIGYQDYQRICVFVVLSMLLVRKRGLYQGTGYSRYFSNGFYHGGLQFSSVSFFAENFKIGKFYLVLFPFLFMLIL